MSLFTATIRTVGMFFKFVTNLGKFIIKGFKFLTEMIKMEWYS